MVSQLIIGTITISILHGLIPSHWIPILAFESKYNWDRSKTIRVTIISALAHALSTVILGVLIGFLSFKISKEYELLFKYVSSALLVVLGLIFIIRHHHHNHFHLHNEEQLAHSSPARIMAVLFLSMFLSPCLEIEGYYIIAGGLGVFYILLVSLLYISISIGGIVMWLLFAKKVMSRINAHKIEHNSGLISGCVLIVTGILNIFVH